MKARLMLEVEYDPTLTDPDALADACDRLWGAALSSPNTWSEYGQPVFGNFSVAEESPRVVIVVEGGVVQTVCCSNATLEVILIDWDVEGSEDNQELVNVPRRGQLPLHAFVTNFPVSLLDELGTDAELVIREAGLEAFLEPGNT